MIPDLFGRMLLKAVFAVATPLFLRLSPHPDSRIEVALGEQVLPVRMLVVGAGVAVGYGVAGARQALPGRLATHLSTRTGRGVDALTRVRADAAVADLAGLAEAGLLAKQDLVVVCPALPDLVEAGSPRWHTALFGSVQRIRRAMPTDSRLVLVGLPMPQREGLLERHARPAITATNRAISDVARSTSNAVYVPAPAFDTLRPGGRSFDAAFYDRCALRIADVVARDVGLRTLAP